MSTVRKRGDAWQAIVRVKKNGEMVHQESRSFTGPRAEMLARDWADRLEKRIAQGGVPNRKLESTTLGKLLTSYAEKRAELKPLRRAMEHELYQLAGEFDRHKLDSLTSETFTKYALRRRAEGVGGATILHNLSTVRSVLNAARPMFGLEIDGGVLGEAISALKTVGAVSKSVSRDRRPTTEELNRLTEEFERVASHPSTVIPMAKIISLAVVLPRRLGELTRMRWADLKDNVITLEDTKHPATPRTEHVPVPPDAATIIAEMPVIDERILPYNPESVSAAFQRACDRLGIEDLRFHDLRHEGITRLFERGLDIQHVSAISGHQSWAMLKRYTHIKPATILEKFT